MDSEHKVKSIISEAKPLSSKIEPCKEEVIEKVDSVCDVCVTQDNDRLEASLSYSNKITSGQFKLEYEEVKKTILTLMKESSQGKDLIADKALRMLGITCRGRNRTKFRNKVMRVVTDLRRTGIIQEYETDSRKRLKLDQQGTLF